MTDLGTLGGTYSYGYGINASGQVTGEANTAGGASHAFLDTGGVMTDLGTLGGNLSYGAGINASGQVTGEADTAGGAQHAFLDTGGVMTDLNTLINPQSGWTLIVGTGINDAGQITGDALNGAGLEHAFLLTLVNAAVPEPSTWAMMLVGFGGLGATLRARRKHASVAA